MTWTADSAKEAVISKDGYKHPNNAIRTYAFALVVGALTLDDVKNWQAVADTANQLDQQARNIGQGG